MAKVNLDALIQREDFEVEETDNPGKKKETISIQDLEAESFFYPYLRKPDFQRETNEWDNEKIVQFIESFVDGDLIPAIILWRSAGGYLFVIDGSHRISSIVSWINDDYGDGLISKQFYDGIIPEEQIEIAEQTRKLVRKRIGTYLDYKLSRTNPEKVDSTIIKRAKNLGALAIQLQWVEGDVKKAESSFFKINQQAAPIDPTELKLLESRKKPNCIAARAIIRGGKGHKYWAKFSKDNQEKIQQISKDINEMLFSPKLDTPIKTLDIPIGGKLYSAQTLPLILEFVNLTNKIAADFKDTVNDDENGNETFKILSQTRKIAQRINSSHPSSLGLHPIVYFYSRDGRHKIASFFATVSFVMELERKNRFDDFTKVRSDFEQVLINSDYIVQQINRRYRSANKSYSHIKDFYFLIVDELLKKTEPKNIIPKIIIMKNFEYLKIEPEIEEITSKDFSTNRKSSVYIKEAIANPVRCKICNGFIHRNSITTDHIIRKQDGGLGNIDNGQISHPYCNSTFKINNVFI